MKKVISGVLTSLNNSIRNEWDTQWESIYSDTVPQDLKDVIYNLSLYSSSASIDQNHAAQSMLQRGVLEFKVMLLCMLLDEFNQESEYDHRHFTEKLNENFNSGFFDELRVTLAQKSLKFSADPEKELRAYRWMQDTIRNFLEHLQDILTSEWSETFYIGFFNEVRNVVEALDALGLYANQNMLLAMAQDPSRHVIVLERSDVQRKADFVWDESADSVDKLTTALETYAMQPVVWLVDGRLIYNIEFYTLDKGEHVKICSIKPGVLDAINH